MHLAVFTPLAGAAPYYWISVKLCILQCSHHWLGLHPITGYQSNCASCSVHTTGWGCTLFLDISQTVHLAVFTPLAGAAPYFWISVKLCILQCSHHWLGLHPISGYQSNCASCSVHTTGWGCTLFLDISQTEHLAVFTPLAGAAPYFWISVKLCILQCSHHWLGLHPISGYQSNCASCSVHTTGWGCTLFLDISQTVHLAVFTPLAGAAPYFWISVKLCILQCSHHWLGLHPISGYQSNCASCSVHTTGWGCTLFLDISQTVHLAVFTPLAGAAPYFWISVKLCILQCSHHWLGLHPISGEDIILIDINDISECLSLLFTLEL